MAISRGRISWRVASSSRITTKPSWRRIGAAGKSLGMRMGMVGEILKTGGGAKSERYRRVGISTGRPAGNSLAHIEWGANGE